MSVFRIQKNHLVVELHKDNIKGGEATRGGTQVSNKERHEKEGGEDVGGGGWCGNRNQKNPDDVEEQLTNRYGNLEHVIPNLGKRHHGSNQNQSNEWISCGQAQPRPNLFISH